MFEENNNNAQTVLNIILHMFCDKKITICFDFYFNDFISALNLYILQEAVVMLKLAATNWYTLFPCYSAKTAAGHGSYSI